MSLMTKRSASLLGTTGIELLMRGLIGLVMSILFVGTLFAQEEPPKHEIRVTPDSKCPGRLSISVEAPEIFLGNTDAAEAKIAAEFSRKLDWLMAILEQAVPTLGLEMAYIDSMQDEQGVTHNLTVTGTDGPFLLMADGTTTNSLRLALEAFERYSLPESVPIRAGKLCLKLGPLAAELGLEGKGNLTVRAPMRSLEALEIPELRHNRRGFITLEDGQGRSYAETAFDWPGLVHVSSGGDCELSIFVSPPRKGVVTPISFGPLSPAAAASGTVAQTRMSRPGEVLERRLEKAKREYSETEGPGDGAGRKMGVLKISPYTELLRAVYMPGVQVLKESPGKKAYQVQIRIRGASQNEKATWKSLAGKLNTRPAGSKEGGDVCLADLSGKELVRFRAGGWELEQFGRSLWGLDKMETLVLLDVKKAGLGATGVVAFKLSDSDLSKFQSLLLHSSDAMFRATLEKPPSRARDAYLQVPVEGGTTLRMRVRVAPSMLLSPEDTLSIEGNGFSFNLKLVAFEDGDGLLEATTTDWGATKPVEVPAKAFSVWSQPVRVSYGPAAQGVLVALVEEAGNVVGSAEEQFWLNLTAERPQTGTCSLILKPAGPTTARDVNFTWLESWELGRVKKAEVLEQEKFNIWYRYPVPSSCGAR